MAVDFIQFFHGLTEYTTTRIFLSAFICSVSIYFVPKNPSRNKGFVQLAPLVFLAILIITTTVIVNQFRTQSQDIRSQAGKYNAFSQGGKWNVREGCVGKGCVSGPEVKPGGYAITKAPVVATITPKTTTPVPTLVSIGSSYTSTECTARGGKLTNGQCMIAASLVSTPVAGSGGDSSGTTIKGVKPNNNGKCPDGLVLCGAADGTCVTLSQCQDIGKAPPTKAPGIAVVPSLTPTVAPAPISGRATCAGGQIQDKGTKQWRSPQTGDLLLGEKNHIYQCGADGKYKDVTPQGYTYDDLTYVPPSITRTDATAKATFQEAFANPNQSKGASCAGGGKTVILSGTVAVGPRAGGRAKCDNGRWVDCANCLFTPGYEPDSVKNDPAYQKQAADYQKKIADATQKLLEAYNACIASGKTDCLEAAKKGIDVTSDAGRQAVTQYTQSVKLATGYYPALKAYKDCASSHTNDPAACSELQRKANIAYKETGLPTDLKTKETYYDTDGFSSFVQRDIGSVQPGGGETIVDKAFVSYFSEYKKNHPTATETDGLEAFQQEQAAAASRMIPRLTALGLIKDPSDANDPYMKPLFTGQRVWTDVEEAYEANKNKNIGTWLIISFNEWTQGASKRGNDLVNSACYGKNKNGFDCLRGGLIQGAAPAAAAAMIPALALAPAVVPAYGVLTVGSAALGIGVTTTSLQHTAEACAANTIITKECGTAAAWTAFSGATTGLGVASATLRAAQVAVDVQAGANLAKGGSELVQVANETATLQRAAQVANLTNQAATVAKVEKIVGVGGTVLFGSQAVTACREGLSWECGINAAAAAGSGLRAVAAFTRIAQTSETAAKVIQTASKGEQILVGGGFAALSCGSVLTTRDFIGCTQALGFAALGAGGLREPARPPGQATPREISEQSPGAKFEIAKQELAALYDAQGKLLPGTDPLLVTPREEALRIAIQQKGLYDGMVEVAMRPVKGIPETAGVKELTIRQQEYQAALDIYNREAANLPVNERIQDSRFIRLEQTKQALIEASGTVAIEKRALESPRNVVEKVIDRVRRAIGPERAELVSLRAAQEELLQEGSRIDITTPEGKRVYETYLDRALNAKAAVENMRLTGEQKTIAALRSEQQQELLDAQRSRAAAEERLKLFEDPVIAAKAVSEASTRLTKLQEERVLLGESEVRWDSATRAWKNSEGAVIDRLFADFEFNPVTGKWKPVTGTGPELETAVVAREQNRLLIELRNRLDTTISQQARTVSEVNKIKALADGRAAGDATGLAEYSRQKSEFDRLTSEVQEGERIIADLNGQYKKAGSLLGRIQGTGKKSTAPLVSGLAVVKGSPQEAQILEQERSSERVKKISGFADTLENNSAVKRPVIEKVAEIKIAADAVRELEARRASSAELFTTKTKAEEALKVASENIRDASDTLGIQKARDAADAVRVADIAIAKSAKEQRVLSRMQTLLDETVVLEAKGRRTTLEDRQLDAANYEIKGLRELQDIVISTGDVRVDHIIEYAIRQQETNVNAVRANRVPQVFSFRDNQIQLVIHGLSTGFELSVLTTSGGKTSAVAPLLMQLGHELYGRTGLYLTKEGLASAAYETMRANLGDDVFLLTQGSDYRRLLDAYTSEGKKYIVTDGGGLAYLRNETRRPDLSPEARLAAKKLYTIATSKIQSFMDEAPRLLDTNITHISTFGEGTLRGSAQQKVTVRLMEETLKDIGVLKIGAPDTAVLTPEGKPMFAKLEHGSVSWTEEGIRSVFQKFADRGVFDEGGHVDMTKRAQAVELAIKAGFNDPAAEQFIADNKISEFVQSKVIEYNDIASRFDSMMGLKRGTNAFWNEEFGYAMLGRDGNEQPAQRDSAIVTALAREAITASMFGRAPDLDSVFVNGKAIKSTIFNVLQDIRAGDSAMLASTGALGTSKAVAEMMFDRVIDNPVATERYFGSRDASGTYKTPTWGDKFSEADIHANRTVTEALDAYVSEKASGRLDENYSGARNERDIHYLTMAVPGTPVEDVAAHLYRSSGFGKDYTYFARYPDGSFYEVIFDGAGRPVKGVNADARIVDVNHANTPAAGEGIPNKSVIINGEGGIEGVNVVLGSGQSFRAFADADRPLSEVTQELSRSNRTDLQPQKIGLYLVATEKIPVENIPTTHEGLYELFSRQDVAINKTNRTAGTGIALDTVSTSAMNSLLRSLEAEALAAKTPAAAAAIEKKANVVREALAGVQNAEANVLQVSFIRGEESYLTIRKNQIAATRQQYTGLLDPTKNLEFSNLVSEFEVSADLSRQQVARDIRANASANENLLVFAPDIGPVTPISALPAARNLVDYMTIHAQAVKVSDVLENLPSGPKTEVQVMRSLSSAIEGQQRIAEAYRQSFLKGVQEQLAQTIPGVGGLLRRPIIPALSDDETAAKTAGEAAARSSRQIAAGLSAAKKSPDALTVLDRQNLIAGFVAARETPAATAVSDGFVIRLPGGQKLAAINGVTLTLLIRNASGDEMASVVLPNTTATDVPTKLTELQSLLAAKMAGSAYTTTGSIDVIAEERGETRQQSSVINPTEFASGRQGIDARVAQTTEQQLERAYKNDVATRLARAGKLTPDDVIRAAALGNPAVDAIIAYETAARAGDVGTKKQEAENAVGVFLSALGKKEDKAAVLTQTSGMVVNAYQQLAREALALTRRENFRATLVNQIVAGTKIFNEPLVYLRTVGKRIAAIFYRGELEENKPAIITEEKLAVPAAAPPVAVKAPSQVVADAVSAVQKLETSGPVADASLRMSILAGIVAIEKDSTLNNGVKAGMDAAYEADVAYRLAGALGMTVTEVQSGVGGKAAITAIAMREVASALQPEDTSDPHRQVALDAIAVLAPIKTADEVLKNVSDNLIASWRSQSSVSTASQLSTKNVREFFSTLWAKITSMNLRDIKRGPFTTLTEDEMRTAMQTRRWRMDGRWAILNATPRDNTRWFIGTRAVGAATGMLNPFMWWDAARILGTRGGWQMYWIQHPAPQAAAPAGFVANPYPGSGSKFIPMAWSPVAPVEKQMRLRNTQADIDVYVIEYEKYLRTAPEQRGASESDIQQELIRVRSTLTLDPVESIFEAPLVAAGEILRQKNITTVYSDASGKSWPTTDIGFDGATLSEENKQILVQHGATLYGIQYHLSIDATSKTPEQISAEYVAIVNLLQSQAVSRPGTPIAPRIGTPAWESVMQGGTQEENNVWRVWSSLVDPTRAGSNADILTVEEKEAARLRLLALYAAESTGVPTAIQQSYIPTTTPAPVVTSPPSPAPTTVPSLAPSPSPASGGRTRNVTQQAADRIAALNETALQNELLALAKTNNLDVNKGLVPAAYTLVAGKVGITITGPQDPNYRSDAITPIPIKNAIRDKAIAVELKAYPQYQAYLWDRTVEKIQLDIKNRSFLPLIQDTADWMQLGIDGMLQNISKRFQPAPEGPPATDGGIQVTTEHIEDLEFSLPLRPEYEQVLVELPTDTTPISFRKQARLAAYMLQALDNGTPLITKDGRNLQPELDRFANALANSGFATPYPTAKLRSVDPVKRFPAWLLARRTTDLAVTKGEADAIDAYTEEYFNRYGKKESEGFNGDIYVFEKNRGAKGVQKPFPYNLKLYIDGSAAKNKEGVLKFFDLLAGANIHPDKAKLFYRSQITMYWEGGVSSDEIKLVETFANQAGIAVRGPAQDVVQLQIPTDRNNHSPYTFSMSNDKSLGGFSYQNNFSWRGETYNKGEFLRQWLLTTFQGEKNPSNPYMLAFVRGDVKEGMSVDDFIKAVGSVDTAGLPIVYASGEGKFNVFDTTIVTKVLRIVEPAPPAPATTVEETDAFADYFFPTQEAKAKYQQERAALDALYAPYQAVLQDYGHSAAPGKWEFVNNSPDEGYKIHLNVKPENVIAVSQFLKSHDYMHKYLSGGEVEDGKVFTVYTGSKTQTERIVREISDGVGNFLEAPLARGELPFAPNIVGRFVGTRQYFHQYGYDGITLLEFDAGQVLYKTTDKDEFIKQAVARAKTRLTEIYGDYYGGGITFYQPASGAGVDTSTQMVTKALGADLISAIKTQIPDADDQQAIIDFYAARTWHAFYSHEMTLPDEKTLRTRLAGLSDSDFDAWYTKVKEHVGSIPVYSTSVLAGFARQNYAIALRMDAVNLNGANGVLENRSVGDIDLRIIAGETLALLKGKGLADEAILARDELSDEHVILLPDGATLPNGFADELKARLQKIHAPFVVDGKLVFDSVDVSINEDSPVDDQYTELVAEAPSQTIVPAADVADAVIQFHPEIAYYFDRFTNLANGTRAALQWIIFEIFLDRQAKGAVPAGMNAHIYKDSRDYWQGLRQNGLHHTVVKVDIPGVQKMINTDLGYTEGNAYIHELYVRMLTVLHQKGITDVYILRRGSEFFIAVPDSEPSSVEALMATIRDGVGAEYNGYALLPAVSAASLTLITDTEEQGLSGDGLTNVARFSTLLEALAEHGDIAFEALLESAFVYGKPAGVQNTFLYRYLNPDPSVEKRGPSRLQRFDATPAEIAAMRANETAGGNQWKADILRILTRHFAPPAPGTSEKSTVVPKPALNETELLIVKGAIARSITQLWQEELQKAKIEAIADMLTSNRIFVAVADGQPDEAILPLIISILTTHDITNTTLAAGEYGFSQDHVARELLQIARAEFSGIDKTAAPATELLGMRVVGMMESPEAQSPEVWKDLRAAIEVRLGTEEYQRFQKELEDRRAAQEKAAARPGEESQTLTQRAQQVIEERAQAARDWVGKYLLSAPAAPTREIIKLPEAPKPPIDPLVAIGNTLRTGFAALSPQELRKASTLGTNSRAVRAMARAAYWAEQSHPMIAALEKIRETRMLAQFYQSYQAQKTQGMVLQVDFSSLSQAILSVQYQDQSAFLARVEAIILSDEFVKNAVVGGYSDATIQSSIDRVLGEQKVTGELFMYFGVTKAGWMTSMMTSLRTQYARDISAEQTQQAAAIRQMHKDIRAWNDAVVAHENAFKDYQFAYNQAILTIFAGDNAIINDFVAGKDEADIRRAIQAILTINGIDDALLTTAGIAKTQENLAGELYAQIDGYFGDLRAARLTGQNIAEALPVRQGEFAADWTTGLTAADAQGIEAFLAAQPNPASELLAMRRAMRTKFPAIVEPPKPTIGVSIRPQTTSEDTIVRAAFDAVKGQMTGDLAPWETYVLPKLGPLLAEGRKYKVEVPDGYDNQGLTDDTSVFVNEKEYKPIGHGQGKNAYRLDDGRILKVAKGTFDSGNIKDMHTFFVSGTDKMVDMYALGYVDERQAGRMFIVQEEGDVYTPNDFTFSFTASSFSETRQQWEQQRAQGGQDAFRRAQEATLQKLSINTEEEFDQLEALTRWATEEMKINDYGPNPDRASIARRKGTREFVIWDAGLANPEGALSSLYESSNNYAFYSDLRTKAKGLSVPTASQTQNAIETIVDALIDQTKIDWGSLVTESFIRSITPPFALFISGNDLRSTVNNLLKDSQFKASASSIRAQMVGDINIIRERLAIYLRVIGTVAIKNPSQAPAALTEVQKTIEALEKGTWGSVAEGQAIISSFLPSTITAEEFTPYLEALLSTRKPSQDDVFRQRVRTLIDPLHIAVMSEKDIDTFISNIPDDAVQRVTGIRGMKSYALRNFDSEAAKGAWPKLREELVAYQKEAAQIVRDDPQKAFLGYLTNQRYDTSVSKLELEDYEDIQFRLMQLYSGDRYHVEYDWDKPESLVVNGQAADVVTIRKRRVFRLKTGEILKIGRVSRVIGELELSLVDSYLRATSPIVGWGMAGELFYLIEKDLDTDPFLDKGGDRISPRNVAEVQAEYQALKAKNASRSNLDDYIRSFGFLDPILFEQTLSLISHVATHYGIFDFVAPSGDPQIGKDRTDGTARWLDLEIIFNSNVRPADTTYLDRFTKVNNWLRDTYIPLALEALHTLGVTLPGGTTPPSEETKPPTGPEGPSGGLPGGGKESGFPGQSDLGQGGAPVAQFSGVYADVEGEIFTAFSIPNPSLVGSEASWRQIREAMTKEIQSRLKGKLGDQPGIAEFSKDKVDEIVSGLGNWAVTDAADLNEQILAIQSLAKNDLEDKGIDREWETARARLNFQSMTPAQTWFLGLAYESTRQSHKETLIKRFQDLKANIEAGLPKQKLSAEQIWQREIYREISAQIESGNINWQTVALFGSHRIGILEQKGTIVLLADNQALPLQFGNNTVRIGNQQIPVRLEKLTKRNAYQVIFPGLDQVTFVPTKDIEAQSIWKKFLRPTALILQLFGAWSTLSIAPSPLADQETAAISNELNATAEELEAVYERQSESRYVGMTIASPRPTLDTALVGMPEMVTSLSDRETTRYSALPTTYSEVMNLAYQGRVPLYIAGGITANTKEQHFNIPKSYYVSFYDSPYLTLKVHDGEQLVYGTNSIYLPIYARHDGTLAPKLYASGEANLLVTDIEVIEKVVNWNGKNYQIFEKWGSIVLPEGQEGFILMEQYVPSGKDGELTLQVNVRELQEATEGRFGPALGYGITASGVDWTMEKQHVLQKAVAILNGEVADGRGQTGQKVIPPGGQISIVDLYGGIRAAEGFVDYKLYLFSKGATDSPEQAKQYIQEIIQGPYEQWKKTQGNENKTYDEYFVEVGINQPGFPAGGIRVGDKLTWSPGGGLCATETAFGRAMEAAGFKLINPGDLHSIPSYGAVPGVTNGQSGVGREYMLSVIDEDTTIEPGETASVWRNPYDFPVTVRAVTTPTSFEFYVLPVNPADAAALTEARGNVVVNGPFVEPEDLMAAMNGSGHRVYSYEVGKLTSEGFASVNRRSSSYDNIVDYNNLNLTASAWQSQYAYLRTAFTGLVSGLPFPVPEVQQESQGAFIPATQNERFVTTLMDLLNTWQDSGESATRLPGDYLREHLEATEFAPLLSDTAFKDRMDHVDRIYATWRQVYPDQEIQCVDFVVLLSGGGFALSPMDVSGAAGGVNVAKQLVGGIEEDDDGFLEKPDYVVLRVSNLNVFEEGDLGVIHNKGSTNPGHVFYVMRVNKDASGNAISIVVADANYRYDSAEGKVIPDGQIRIKELTAEMIQQEYGAMDTSKYKAQIAVIRSYTKYAPQTAQSQDTGAVAPTVSSLFGLIGLRALNNIPGVRAIREGIDKLRQIVSRQDAVDQWGVVLLDDETKTESRRIQAEFVDELAFIQDAEKAENQLGRTAATFSEAVRKVYGFTLSPSQLIAGYIGVVDGDFAEVQTGMGKTLITAFNAFARSLDSRQVHVTSEKFSLIDKDEKQLTALYKALGVDMAVLRPGMKLSDVQAKIIYTTLQTLIFDAMQGLRTGEGVQDLTDVALVMDEADTSFDTTPLVISGGEEVLTNAEDIQRVEALVSELLSQNENEKYVTFDEAGGTPTLTPEGAERLKNLDNGLVTTALRAHTMERGKDYFVSATGGIIVRNKVAQIAEPGKRFQEGRTQALEAKEGLPIHPDYATVDQTYYALYLKKYGNVSGYSSTLLQIEDDIRASLGKNVRVIPSRAEVEMAQRKLVKVAIRKDVDTWIEGYAREVNGILEVVEEGRWDLKPVIARTKAEIYRTMARDAVAQSRSHAVLVAVGDENEAAQLTRYFAAAGRNVQVLTEYTPQIEREHIIQEAGRMGNITISTLTGRGTDIQSPHLFVMGTGLLPTERKEQIQGRTNRINAATGYRNPGTTRWYYAVEYAYDTLGAFASIGDALESLPSGILEGRNKKRALSAIQGWEKALDSRYAQQREQQREQDTQTAGVFATARENYENTLRLASSADSIGRVLDQLIDRKVAPEDRTSVKETVAARLTNPSERERLQDLVRQATIKAWEQYLSELKVLQTTLPLEAQALQKDYLMLYKSRAADLRNAFNQQITDSVVVEILAQPYTQ